MMSYSVAFFCRISHYFCDKRPVFLLNICNRKTFSRYFHSFPFRNMMAFKLSDYDCIGFDLDNTLCRYRLDTLFPLIYSKLCQFLVEKKGYDEELTLQPFDNGQDFLQKGLVLDVSRGNLLKVGDKGIILRASHGTRPMNPSEIAGTYGHQRLWQPVVDFAKNPCEAQVSDDLWAFNDYFDMPFALVCGRLVDVVDRQFCGVGSKATTSGNCPSYSFRSDVLDGVFALYGSDEASVDAGWFHEAVKADIARYVVPCSDSVKTWLRRLKFEERKQVFLLTSAKECSASMLAEYCLGSDWRDYFDVVLTFASKPGFFTGHRTFYSSTASGGGGNMPVENNSLQCGRIYSQGNYKELLEFLSQASGKPDPKVVYFGDHLIHDVYTPARYSRCHAVAIVEELEAEGMLSDRPEDRHRAAPCLSSSRWGSFFYDDDTLAGTGNSTVRGTAQINTAWAQLLVTYSQIAIPKLDTLASLPVETELSRFGMPDSSSCSSGFHPADPKILHI